MNLERALGEFESEVMPSELPQSLLQIEHLKILLAPIKNLAVEKNMNY